MDHKLCCKVMPQPTTMSRFHNLNTIEYDNCTILKNLLQIRFNRFSGKLPLVKSDNGL